MLFGFEDFAGKVYGSRLPVEESCTLKHGKMPKNQSIRYSNLGFKRSLSVTSSYHLVQGSERSIVSQEGS